jgi:hypothetical protein
MVVNAITYTWHCGFDIMYVSKGDYICSGFQVGLRILGLVGNLGNGMKINIVQLRLWGFSRKYYDGATFVIVTFIFRGY